MSFFKGFFTSSVNPQNVSLTVESFGKSVVGIVGWYLIAQHMNPAVATTQVQTITDLVAQSVPIAFTLWNNMLTGYGLVRKLCVYFSSPTIVPVVTP